jgi:1-acyl-sn-glycerol-3-phosphate acyltransferase
MTRDRLYRLGRSVITWYTRVMLRMDVVWEAPLPAGPKILAPNHPTTTDPFYLMALTDEPMSILVTGAAFEVPVFGRYLHAAGHVPVAKGAGASPAARRAVFEAARYLLEQGRTVAIFPEGSLSPAERGLCRPRTGAARLALITGAPVIPIGIALVPERIRRFEPEIEGQTEFGRLYLRGPYALTVGRPLWVEGNVEDWEHVRQEAGRIMDRIALLMQSSQARIEAARSGRQSRGLGTAQPRRPQAGASACPRWVQG